MKKKVYRERYKTIENEKEIKLTNSVKSAKKKKSDK